MFFGLVPLPQIPFWQVLVGAAAGVGAFILLHLAFALSTKVAVRHAAPRHWFSLLVYLIFLLVVGVLAVTSFGSIWQVGHMSHYALLSHVAAAGAFTFLLLVIAVLFLPRGTEEGDRTFTADQAWWLGRWSAWLLVASGLATAGTMFLSMLPVLDTAGLLEVAELHRYAGLTTVAAAILHAYSLICTRIGLR